MDTKTRIEVYRKFVDEVSKEYEFIRNKINELCSEHIISAEEVCLYIFMLVLLRTQFSYIHSLARI